MKRIFSALLAALTVFSTATSMPALANAAEPTNVASVASVYSSDYLSSYNSFASKAGPGKMDITYEVYGTTISNVIGVSKIEIYEISGTKVKTVYGSLSNGLQDSNISMHADTYRYEGTPGTTYYAKVTVFASRSTGSDSRTIITNSVTV